jgi:hypothetical protein
MALLFREFWSVNTMKTSTVWHTELNFEGPSDQRNPIGLKIGKDTA